MSAKDAQIPSHQSQPAAQRAPPSDWMCTVAGTPPRLLAATKCPRELRRNSHQQIAPNEGLMSHYIASGERASHPSPGQEWWYGRKKRRKKEREARNHLSKSLSSTHRVRHHTTANVSPSHKGTKTSPHEAHVGCCHTVVSRCAAPKTELSNHQPQAASPPPPPPR